MQSRTWRANHLLNLIIFHSMTEVLNFCANFGPSHSQTTCGEGYFYVEKIQMTIFCLQEFIISGIYVWKTSKLLKVVSQTRPRQVMWQLFSINVIIIIMDIAIKLCWGLIVFDVALFKINHPLRSSVFVCPDFGRK